MSPLNGPDKKILFKKQLFDFEVKVKVSRRSLRYATHRGQSPTKVIMVCDTPPYGHAPTTNITDLSGKTKNYGPDKLCWEEAQEVEEAEEKNQTKTICLPSFEKGRRNSKKFLNGWWKNSNKSYSTNKILHL